MSNPFGTEITPEEIVDTLGFFDSWEDRYRYIIDLGKQLPEMDDAKKTEDRIVKGCQSQVWLYPEYKDGIVYFKAWSDAVLVKGIIGLLVKAYSESTPEEIKIIKNYIKNK